LHIGLFCPNYGQVVAPLTNILRNKGYASKRDRKKSIPWGPEEQKAFEELKVRLVSPPIQVFPDWDK
ncbi:unnamed protein product, partial [Choristocarpus tenellus]